MKRLVAVASASFALFLAACDDDDPKRPDAGREAGAEVSSEVGGEAGAPGACIGTFAGTNRTMLGAASRPGGMCNNPTDLDLVCMADIGGQIRTNYARACLPALTVGGNAAVVSCIEMGVKRDFNLSAGCLSCYTGSIVCTLEKCLIPCSQDATSTACSTCQAQMGCLSQFFTCSGLPGGGPAPDGGADAGGDVRPADGGTDAAVDGGTDAPVDAPGDTAADTATDTGSDV